MKKLYYRFGDIPEDGYSSIWRIDELIGKEKGVSVYEAYKNIDGTYVPVIPFPVTEKGLNDFIYYMAYYYGSRYLYSLTLWGLFIHIRGYFCVNFYIIAFV